MNRSLSNECKSTLKTGQAALVSRIRSALHVYASLTRDSVSHGLRCHRTFVYVILLSTPFVSSICVYYLLRSLPLGFVIRPLCCASCLLVLLFNNSPSLATRIRVQQRDLTPVELLRLKVAFSTTPRSMVRALSARARPVKPALVPYAACPPGPVSLGLLLPSSASPLCGFLPRSALLLYRILSMACYSIRITAIFPGPRDFHVTKISVDKA